MSPFVIKGPRDAHLSRSTMSNLIGTWFWGRSCPDSGAARLEPRPAPGSVRPLECRRLKLLLVLTFCAITGARPVMAGFVQKPIVTPVLLPVHTKRDLAGSQSAVGGMAPGVHSRASEFPLPSCGFYTGVTGSTLEPYVLHDVFLHQRGSIRRSKE